MEISPELSIEKCKIFRDCTVPRVLAGNKHLQLSTTETLKWVLSCHKKKEKKCSTIVFSANKTLNTQISCYLNRWTLQWWRQTTGWRFCRIGHIWECRLPGHWLRSVAWSACPLTDTVAGFCKIIHWVVLIYYCRDQQCGQYKWVLNVWDSGNNTRKGWQTSSMQTQQ